MDLVSNSHVFVVGEALRTSEQFCLLYFNWILSMWQVKILPKSVFR